jgi:hypothetical protein
MEEIIDLTNAFTKPLTADESDTGCDNEVAPPGYWYRYGPRQQVIPEAL